MRDDAGFRFGGAPQQFVPTATHLRAKGADLAALHHWELSDVSSVFGGVLAGWVDIDSRQQPGSRTSYQIVKAGYSRALGRGRVALEGRVVLDHRSRAAVDQQSFEAMATWVWRSTWATLRLGAGFSTAD